MLEQGFNANISDEELGQLPAGAFGGRVTVIESEDAINEACDYLLRQPVIGFDTETRPAFTAGVKYKVALLQLSTDERCILFRLNKIRLDKAIIKVLENPNVTKVGAAIHDDLKALINLRHFRPRGFADLQQLVGEHGIEARSVRKMAGIMLGIRISKAQRLSNWEASALTPAQQLYAATDAWVCGRMYTELVRRKNQR